MHDGGVVTIGDLQDTTIDLLPLVGSFATTLKERAFGNDDRPVDPSDERKSISSEATFLEDTDDRATLCGALKELAEDVAQTLAKHDVGALTVQVKVRYSDFTTLTRQLRVEDPVSSSREIYYRLACILLARDCLVNWPPAPRLDWRFDAHTGVASSAAPPSALSQRAAASEALARSRGKRVGLARGWATMISIDPALPPDEYPDPFR